MKFSANRIAAKVKATPTSMATTMTAFFMLWPNIQGERLRSLHPAGSAWSDNVPTRIKTGDFSLRQNLPHVPFYALTKFFCQ